MVSFLAWLLGKQSVSGERSLNQESHSSRSEAAMNYAFATYLRPISTACRGWHMVMMVICLNLLSPTHLSRPRKLQTTPA